HVDRPRLTAVLACVPTRRTADFNSNGSFTYTPAANYNGPDSFTYKANDGSADSNVATVSLTVNPVNDAPVANNDAYSTNEDTALSVAAPGVLANDTDVDSPALTATLVTGPSHITRTPNRTPAPTPARAVSPTLPNRPPSELQGRQRRQQRGHGEPHRQPGQRPAGGQQRQLQHQRGHRAERGGTGRTGQRHRCGQPDLDRCPGQRPQ